MHVLVILLIGILVSGIIEYRAVYVLKEWRYGPNMPIILGIGLSPLVHERDRPSGVMVDRPVTLQMRAIFGYIARAWRSSLGG